MDQHGCPHQSLSSTFLIDASSAPVKRTFERLNDALHERRPLSTAKTAPCLSTVFEGIRYQGEKQKVVVESEPNGERSCTETGDILMERLIDEGDQYQEGQEYGLLDYDDENKQHESTMKSVVAYLAVCVVISQNVELRDLRNTQVARFVSIPDDVEELCDECF